LPWHSACGRPPDQPHSCTSEIAVSVSVRDTRRHAYLRTRHHLLYNGHAIHKRVRATRGRALSEVRVSFLVLPVPVRVLPPPYRRVKAVFTCAGVSSGVRSKKRKGVTERPHGPGLQARQNPQRESRGRDSRGAGKIGVAQGGSCEEKLGELRAGAAGAAKGRLAARWARRGAGLAGGKSTVAHPAHGVRAGWPVGLPAGTSTGGSGAREASDIDGSASL
jgi:hypothetical protein